MSERSPALRRLDTLRKAMQAEVENQKNRLAGIDMAINEIEQAEVMESVQKAREDAELVRVGLRSQAP